MFPNAVLPLHIFEPRYRQMTQDALASDKLIAIVQARPDASWSGVEEPRLEAIACLGRIMNHERLADGRYNFLLLGRKRVRILQELTVTTLYRQAQVEILEDIPSPTPETSRRRDLAKLYREIAERTESLDPDLDGLLQSNSSLGVMTDLLAQSLGLPATLKQALLEEVDIDRRVQGLSELLRKVIHQLDAIAKPTRPFPPPFSNN